MSVRLALLAASVAVTIGGAAHAQQSRSSSILGSPDASVQRNLLVGGSITQDAQPPCDILRIRYGYTVSFAASMYRQVCSGATAAWQIEIPSGSSQAVGFNANGFVNVTAAESFASGVPGFVAQITDQSGNGNSEPSASIATMAPFFLYPGVGVPALMTSGNLASYNLRTGTHGLPSGTGPITVYNVFAVDAHGSCCGADALAGLMETNTGIITGGAMFAPGYGGSYSNGLVQPDTDIEGAVPGAPVSAPATPLIMLTASKLLTDGQIQQKVFNAQTGALLRDYKFAPPFPMAVQTGLGAGTGGDLSPSPAEAFETIIVNAQTSDQADLDMAASVACSLGVPAGVGSCATPGQPTLPTPLLDLALNTGCAGNLCGGRNTGAGANDSYLDIEPFIGGAHSCALKLRASYTGPGCTYRRNSDGQTITVQYTASGVADDATAMAFCQQPIGTASVTLVSNGASVGTSTLTLHSGTIAVGNTLTYNLSGVSLLPGTYVISGSGTTWTVGGAQTISTAIAANVVTTCTAQQVPNQAIARQGTAGSNGNDTGNGWWDYVQSTASLQPIVVFNDLNGLTGLRSFGTQYMHTPATTELGNYGPIWANLAVGARIGNTSAAQYLVAAGGNTGVEYQASANTVGTQPGDSGSVPTTTVNDGTFAFVASYLDSAGRTYVQANNGTVVAGTTTSEFFYQGNFFTLFCECYTTNNGSTWTTQGMATADWILDAEAANGGVSNSTGTAGNATTMDFTLTQMSNMYRWASNAAGGAF